MRRRGVPAARHDLRGPPQGDAAPTWCGTSTRRPARAPSATCREEAGRLHGRHAAHDGERRLHHQRPRARHRLPDAPARPACSSTTTRAARLGQVCRRARRPLPRLLARFTSSTPRTSSTSHRPPARAAGDHPLHGPRQPRDAEAARGARGRGQAARAPRSGRHVGRGNPVLFLPQGAVPRQPAGRCPSTRSACAASSSIPISSTPRARRCSPRPAPR